MQSWILHACCFVYASQERNFNSVSTVRWIFDFVFASQEWILFWCLWFVIFVCFVYESQERKLKFQCLWFVRSVDFFVLSISDESLNSFVYELLNLWIVVSLYLNVAPRILKKADQWNICFNYSFFIELQKDI